MYFIDTYINELMEYAVHLVDPGASSDGTSENDFEPIQIPQNLEENMRILLHIPSRTAPDALEDASDGEAAPTEEHLDLELGAEFASPDVLYVTSHPTNVLRLLPLLPRASLDCTAADRVFVTLRSPQFAQVVNQLASSGAAAQLGPLVAELGLPAAVTAAAHVDISALFHAMESAAASDPDASMQGDSDGDEF